MDRHKRLIPAAQCSAQTGILDPLAYWVPREQLFECIVFFKKYSSSFRQGRVGLLEHCGMFLLQNWIHVNILRGQTWRKSGWCRFWQWLDETPMALAGNSMDQLMVSHQEPMFGHFVATQIESAERTKTRSSAAKNAGGGGLASSHPVADFYYFLPKTSTTV